ncbi:MAG: helix-turn-helix transcriptional regulator [Gemmatimonadaceae bacterium]
MGERLLRIINVVFGSSINAAAVAAGVETSTLFRLVEGVVSDPRLKTVRRLADAFGVPASWLLGEVDASQAQQCENPLPEWLWLLDAYSQVRERKLRAWLSEVEVSNPETAELLGQLNGFRLLPTQARSPLAVLDRIVTTHGAAPDEEIRAVRNVYAMQLEILELGIIKLWKLGATPRPPKPGSPERLRVRSRSRR